MCLNNEYHPDYAGGVTDKWVFKYYDSAHDLHFENIQYWKKKMKKDCPTYFLLWRQMVYQEKLVPKLHPHERYIEVFLGGGSIFFRKDKAKINILNILMI